MQKEGKLFDDLARVAGGAMSSFGALRDEAEARMREQFERILTGMELVRRDEFDAVRAMAVKAREENETLLARIEVLEASQAAKPRKARKTTRSSTRKPPAEN
ncbi:MAG: accessory factor UbiK family protein [Alphaproteobacteria bacterium]|jgi:BMFP domain-containing protein YqiC